jgi:hypothetical protein
MLKIEDFRQHAADCRKMASTVRDQEHRKMLEDMASAWDELAAERAQFLRRHPQEDMPSASPFRASLSRSS